MGLVEASDLREVQQSGAVSNEIVVVEPALSAESFLILDRCLVTRADEAGHHFLVVEGAHLGVSEGRTEVVGVPVGDPELAPELVEPNLLWQGDVAWNSNSGSVGPDDPGGKTVEIGDRDILPPAHSEVGPHPRRKVVSRLVREREGESLARRLDFTALRYSPRP